MGYVAPGDALHRLRLIRDTPGMLRELSVVEQRYQAVLAVIRDGVSIVEVAHPTRSAIDADLRAIAEGYKRRFHQDAVLRLTVPARLVFY